MVLVPITSLEAMVQTGEVQPSAVKMVQEGAELVTSERPSGSGKLAAIKSKKSPSAKPKFGGILDKVAQFKEQKRQERNYVASLNRLNEILDRVTHGNMMER